MTHLFSDVRGSSDHAIVLLHGLGGTGEVWSHFRDVLHESTDLSSIAIDLPGHGHSEALQDYRFSEIARIVREKILADHSGYASYAILGHSYGGIVAMELTIDESDFAPDLVLAVGVKLDWADDQLAGTRRIAEKPKREFETKQSAEQFFLKSNGLQPDALNRLERAVAKRADSWQVNQDPATFNIEKPEPKRWLGQKNSKIELARGEHDKMVSPQMPGLPEITLETTPAGGHNCIVDAPQACLDWSQSKLGSALP